MFQVPQHVPCPFTFLKMLKLSLLARHAIYYYRVVDTAIVSTSKTATWNMHLLNRERENGTNHKILFNSHHSSEELFPLSIFLAFLTSCVPKIHCLMLKCGTNSPFHGDGVETENRAENEEGEANALEN